MRSPSPVLGQHTFFHFETEQKPGDTRRKVLQRCPRPVVAVPEKLRAGGGVMVAYDASIQAARAVQAIQWLGLADSELVHVVSVDRDWATAQRQAEIATEFLRTHKIDARAVPVASSDSPADVILNQLNLSNGRLLVMGAGHCPVPVLLYH